MRIKKRAKKMLGRYVIARRPSSALLSTGVHDIYECVGFDLGWAKIHLIAFGTGTKTTGRIKDFRLAAPEEISATVTQRIKGPPTDTYSYNVTRMYDQTIEGYKTIKVTPNHDRMKV